MYQETYDWIKKNFPNINDGMIKVISEEAYDQGHSAGQEEVNCIAKNLAYFVNDILNSQ